MKVGNLREASVFRETPPPLYTDRWKHQFIVSVTLITGPSTSQPCGEPHLTELLPQALTISTHSCNQLSTCLSRCVSTTFHLTLALTALHPLLPHTCTDCTLRITDSGRLPLRRRVYELPLSQ